MNQSEIITQVHECVAMIRQLADTHDRLTNRVGGPSNYETDAILKAANDLAKRVQLLAQMPVE